MTVTIREIAKQSGVSTATVSRVLNESPLVRPDTKKRVMQVIRAYHYKPNLLARALSKNKSDTIGLFVPPGTHLFVSGYFNELLHGIDDTARRYGYDLLLRNTDTGMSETSYIQSLEMKKCDGLLVIAPTLNDERVKQLEGKNIPVVLVNSVSETLSYVDVDNIGGSCGIVNHLIKLGHKRIAIINGVMEGINAQDRFHGYQKALSENGIALQDDIIAYGDYDQESGARAIEKLLKAMPRPTAVFAANDAMAAGAIRFIKAHGLRVPEDIAVVGYDNSVIAELIDPALTTVNQPVYEIGSESVKLLVEQIVNNNKTVRKVVLKPSIVIRESCGAKLSPKSMISEMSSNASMLEQEQRSRLIGPMALTDKNFRGVTDEKELLKGIAADTWGYFRDMVDRLTWLPLDSITFDEAGARPDTHTSAAGMGYYLASLVSGMDLCLIDREEATKRLFGLLDTITRLETRNGLYYSVYETIIPERHNNIISFVDNGILAAGLIVAKQVFGKDMAEKIQKILSGMDFKSLYDEQLGQFYLDYDSSSGRFSPYRHGILCSESRLASFIAIAKKDVGPQHWFKMYRTLPENWTWQSQVPQGGLKQYIGQEIFQGYYKFGETKFVPAFGGSMFEYLMPAIFINEAALAEKNLGMNNERIVNAQVQYALKNAEYPVWGISLCSIPDNPQGFNGYGIRQLASKGYEEKGIIAPYATFLALEIEPSKAVSNIKRLMKVPGLYSNYGFFDALDVKTSRVAKRCMCAGQAMELISLNNYLNGGSIKKRFHSEPMIKEAEGILAIEEFYK